MKRDNKKALYESIMNSVARVVKKALIESYNDNKIERCNTNLLSLYKLFCYHDFKDEYDPLTMGGCQGGFDGTIRTVKSKIKRDFGVDLDYADVKYIINGQEDNEKDIRGYNRYGYFFKEYSFNIVNPKLARLEPVGEYWFNWGAKINRIEKEFIKTFGIDYDYTKYLTGHLTKNEVDIDWGTDDNGILIIIFNAPNLQWKTIWISANEPYLVD